MSSFGEHKQRRVSRTLLWFALPLLFWALPTLAEGNEEFTAGSQHSGKTTDYFPPHESGVNPVSAFASKPKMDALLDALQNQEEDEKLTNNLKSDEKDIVLALKRALRTHAKGDNTSAIMTKLKQMGADAKDRAKQLLSRQIERKEMNINDPKFDGDREAEESHRAAALAVLSSLNEEPFEEHSPPNPAASAVENKTEKFTSEEKSSNPGNIPVPPTTDRASWAPPQPRGASQIAVTKKTISPTKPSSKENKPRLAGYDPESFWKAAAKSSVNEGDSRDKKAPAPSGESQTEGLSASKEGKSLLKEVRDDLASTPLIFEPTSMPESPFTQFSRQFQQAIKANQPQNTATVKP